MSWRAYETLVKQPLDHWQPDLFKGLFSLTTPNAKGQHFWDFLRRIHLSQVDSPHREPAIRKAFPWHKVNMAENFTRPSHVPNDVSFIDGHTRNHTDTRDQTILRPSFQVWGIPMLNIRRSRDRLIFNIGIPMLVRRHLYIEMVPGPDSI